ncbi:MAG: hypothetical protein HY836_11170 [Aquabacterium sp.]|uniref:hypothetical protein n=1 Tax=Aquabacterium sp. TaxID=1872578 RepID=UPI0025BF47AC|nr:hypothetical protein [Aquabacterium sp.]MBI5926149.1 hypothetical protein [Aquabacterium sp.]
MTDADERQLYDHAFASYRDLFGSMDGPARALWFFTMDEAEILSFPVSAGQDHAEAGIRHGVKLAAMADALEALLGSQESAHEVNDLRRIAAQHGYRGKAEGTEPC